MKRLNDLYIKMIDKNNIYKAYCNAREGKGHYRDVKLFESNVTLHIDKLHDMLANDEFANSEYVVFDRFTGGKWRTICKLPFYPDRIVHHCIVQILHPIWLNLLIRDTFSTIEGRGIHDGVKRIKSALKDVEGTQYCLKIDIKKYYPSINHDVLKDILARKIKDARLINLLNIIIDSAEGIPIGNYISQWFGNIYLSYFDHYVKEVIGVKYYYRYADDMIFLSSNKEFLHKCLSLVRDYLILNLKLEIKSNYQIFPVEKRGIDMLGYRFFHTHTLVRKSIVKNFKRKIKNNNASKRTQSAYWGWFKHANAYNLTNKYFNHERIKN